MPGSMAIGYGMADGSGWADTGLSRRFLMRSGFMADGLEIGASFAAAFIVSGDIGVDSCPMLERFGLSSLCRQYLRLTRLYPHLGNGRNGRNWRIEN